MAERTVPDGGPGATVLIVDDEADVTDLYASYLQEYYDVRTAYGGEESLERMNDAVDVVLLDRRMPGLSGDQVLAELRDRGYGCRVVMVTAIEPDFDVVEMAFDDYITKPVDQQTLMETVEKQLILDSYDSRIDEYLKRRSKLSVLEEEKTQAELERSDRYQELKVVTENLRKDIENMVSEHDLLDVDPQDLDPERLERQRRRE